MSRWPDDRRLDDRGSTTGCSAAGGLDDQGKALDRGSTTGGSMTGGPRQPAAGQPDPRRSIGA
jgi:hypothetical protein